MTIACDHPDGIFLYAATNEEGDELTISRCTVCGSKYAEGY